MNNNVIHFPSPDKQPDQPENNHVDGPPAEVLYLVGGTAVRNIQPVPPSVHEEIGYSKYEDRVFDEREVAFSEVFAAYYKIEDLLQNIQPNLLKNVGFKKLSTSFLAIEELNNSGIFPNPIEDLKSFEADHTPEKPYPKKALTPEKARWLREADSLGFLENASILYGSMPNIEIAKTIISSLDPHRRLKSYPGEEPTPTEVALSQYINGAMAFFSTYRFADNDRTKAIQQIRFMFARIAGHDSPYYNDRNAKRPVKQAEIKKAWEMALLQNTDRA